MGKDCPCKNLIGSDCLRDGFGLGTRNPGSQSEGVQLSFRKIFPTAFVNGFCFCRYLRLFMLRAINSYIIGWR